MKVILATVAVALALPFGVYGAQAVFTAKNVTIAYEEQVKAIDAEVARLEGTLIVPETDSTWAERFAIEDGHNLEVRKKITQLLEDKHTLEVAYTLILTSFR